MTTVKRMFRLQQIKIDMLWQAIEGYTDIFRNYVGEIPDAMKDEFIEVSEKLLDLNARIDKAREKNINKFFNSMRNKYEGIFNMEVQDGKENKEEN